jgi:hypothetical protein
MCIPTPTETGSVDWFLALLRLCLARLLFWQRFSIGERYGTHRQPFKRERNSETFVTREGVLVRRFVVAGEAAGFAVHQAVGAETDVELRLAEDAELLARAALFLLPALGADDAAEAWFRGHG